MIDNIEKSNVVFLWSDETTPWQEVNIWTDFPQFSKIDNIEL